MVSLKAAIYGIGEGWFREVRCGERKFGGGLMSLRASLIRERN